MSTVPSNGGTGGYFQIKPGDWENLNRALRYAWEQIDALTGRRGNVALSSDFDLGGHKAINAADPADTTDLVNLEYADAHYGPAAIGKQLSITGSNPLMPSPLLGPGSPVFLEGTHANKPSAPSYGTGSAYYETDRMVSYLNVTNASNLQVWLYSSGAYLAAVASRPADLGANDTGFLFYATDQDSIYVWTGVAWDTITRRILFASNYAIFAATLTGDRTYTLPDATGNLVYETATLTLNNFVLGGGGPLAVDAGFSIVPAVNGGTGQSAYTVGDLLVATGAAVLTQLPDVAVGNALLAGGVGVAPAYGKVSLTTTVSGVLPAANGGTSVSYNRVSDTIALTNQGADIAATAFANSATAGTYRCSYYLIDATADVTAGAVTLTMAFTDGVGATTVASAPVALTGLGTLRASGVFFIQLASGNITYAVSHTGIFGTAKFAVYISLERLS